MVHHGQGLPLGLEPRDHPPRVHARLDDLESHLAADRLVLLGHVDDAHPALTNLLDQLVGADLRAGLLQRRLVDRGWTDLERSFQKMLQLRLGTKQLLDECTKV